ncbi:MAG: hypothetical protein ACR2QG_12185 [Gammaproteobacteria bacterium]
MEKLPFWKAVLLTLAIIAIALIYIFLGSLLGLEDPWISFVALTMWGALGMKMEDAPRIFLGGAAGIMLGYALWQLPELFGAWAAIIPLIGIILAISCHITQRIPLICNFGLFIFLTIVSADMFLEQRPHLMYLQNLAFGAFCFWIVPWAAIKLRPQKHGQDWNPSYLGRLADTL